MPGNWVWRCELFVFKKIVGFWVMPLPALLLAGMVGVVWLWRGRSRNGGRWLVSGVVIGLTLLSFKPVADALVRPLEGRYDAYRAHPERVVAYVVVLGGGVVDDPALPVTSQLSSESLTRLVEGIRIARLHPGSRLVLSGGGATAAFTEAGVMGQVALGLGVPSERIVLEEVARDTENQARLIQDLIGNEPFVLVTSALHLPRAMALFRKRGLGPLPAPTDHRAKALGADWVALLNGIAPRQLEAVHAAVHEYLGLLWSRWRGAI
ncbi:MAG: envelope biogenesis factor ElyC [Magnetococcales bacterium]|nr:envelope biogenesis factor ElyC [Magnetococcales bacterium]